MSKRMRIAVVPIVALLVSALCLVGCGHKSGAQKASSNPPVNGTPEVRSNPLPDMEMVTIPAGEFTMGSNERQDEQPIHKVYLDAYQIGKYEVTVAQYREFCKATGREMPKAPSEGRTDDQPIIGVTWDDASAFCEWAGGRLPSEAEWEKAARGTDGRKYPWGNTWDKTKCANRELGLSSVAPVGSYARGASPYGCQDMAGNAHEWCADWYSPTHYETSPSRNPKGPSSGSYRVLRGGGWGSYYDSGGRCASRGHYGLPDYYYFGFRLAR